MIQPDRVRVARIVLQHFRNFKTLTLDLNASLKDACHHPLVFTAPNGFGKTNLLEALSLLSPGRGLRGDRFVDMQHHHLCTHPWQIGVTLCMGDDSEHTLHFGTHLVCDGARERRVIKRQGVPLKNQASLTEDMSIVWFTPDMGRMLRESGTHQRQFIDRLIFSVDPAHAARRAAYDKHMRERNALLKKMREGSVFGAHDWLDAIEHHMAQYAHAIIHARRTMLHQLEQRQDNDSIFPTFHVDMVGACEDLFKHDPENFQNQAQTLWRTDRTRDIARGSTSFGPHRAKLSVTYIKKNMNGEFCSTGEQKMLVLAILLAFVKMPATVGRIVLLDDVMDHLDKNHRTTLMMAVQQFIREHRGHVWMTGSNTQAFDETGCAYIHITEHDIKD